MEKSPIVLGTGLITMDIVLNNRSEAPPKVFAGGTCGNVLAILGFLGWSSYPLARLNKDSAAKRVMNDLQKWNVKLDFINLEPNTNTPIIVQEIKRNSSGQSYHKFSWTCPHCGAWLPPYRAVRASSVELVLEELPAPKVFFFDRVSRAALILAKKCASKGSIIYFEPSGVSNIKQFREALDLAHVVKYAEDRAPAFKEIISSSKPLVEIETLGKNGLRYRCSLEFSPKRNWVEVPAFQTKVVDAAGAGDWCSAGIIHSIGTAGLTGLKHSSSEAFSAALYTGQAMASWNCGFEGARGGMYETNITAFRRLINTAVKNKKLNQTPSKQGRAIYRQQSFECPSCEGIAVSLQ